MIFDTVENLKLYKGISKNLDDCIDYVLNNDLSLLNDGLNVISDNLTATKLTYVGKETSDHMECHMKHLDMQIILKNKELCGYNHLPSKDILTDYNEVKDVAHPDGTDLFKLCNEVGKFVLFFPEDLHRPSLKVNDEEIVKIVLKVLI